VVLLVNWWSWIGVRSNFAGFNLGEIGFPQPKKMNGIVGLEQSFPVLSSELRIKSVLNVATQSRMFDGVPAPDGVETAPPRVTLRNAFSHPFDSAIAAARTCYSSRLISPEEITDKQRLNIGAATFYRATIPSTSTRISNLDWKM